MILNTLCRKVCIQNCFLFSNVISTHFIFIYIQIYIFSYIFLLKLCNRQQYKENNAMKKTKLNLTLAVLLQTFWNFEKVFTIFLLDFGDL